MYHKILILGGGASGITAAITAKDNNSDVAIIESNNRIGKKILSTGNGRCNISNKDINFSRYHSENPNFFKKVLTSFTVENTINFFSSLGLPLTTLEEGKIYPMSLQASSVLDILRLALEDRNIPIYLNYKVKNIIKTKKGFKIKTNTNEIFECEKLLIACGGTSTPNTGSDGSGFNLATSLGHSLIKPVPSLVQLKLDYKHIKALAGVKFNGIAKLYINSKLQKEEYGEILFTNYGISGPPILQLSRFVSKNLLENNLITLSIDMIPKLSIEDLKNHLENHWGVFNYRSIFQSLIGIINKKIIPVLLKEGQIKNIHKPCYDLEWKEKNNIYTLLKNWKFNVCGTNSFKYSQVTAGGINTKEINNKTMESKIIKNLYFSGEILDVDGDCGGFNLQWAWSSGFIAGKNISKND